MGVGCKCQKSHLQWGNAVGQTEFKGLNSFTDQMSTEEGRCTNYLPQRRETPNFKVPSN